MNFSFRYDEKTYKISDFTDNGKNLICNLGNGVCAYLTVNHYAEYDATEWVLHFSNNGNADSKIFSDINDCDFDYKLTNAQPARNGFMPTFGYP